MPGREGLLLVQLCSQCLMDKASSPCAFTGLTLPACYPRSWQYTFSGLKLLKPRLKRVVQFALPVRSKFGALPGDVEDVRSGTALRVNQAHVNVAAKFGERGADVVEKPRAIEGDNFHNRAVRGALIIEVDSRFHLNFRRALLGLEFSLHKVGYVEVSGNSRDELLLQADGLGRIVVERVEEGRNAE